MTGVSFNLNAFFASNTSELDFDFLSPIEVVNERNMFTFYEEEELEDFMSSILEEVETPPPEIEFYLSLSFEDDRLPLFTDQCEEDILRPEPIYPEELTYALD